MTTYVLKIRKNKCSHSKSNHTQTNLVKVDYDKLSPIRDVGKVLKQNS